MASKFDNESEQLGPKDLNDKDLNKSMLAWTPGNEQRLTGNVYQQNGITKTKDKQVSPVHAYFDNIAKDLEK